jgi:CHAD domain-containing protein
LSAGQMSSRVMRSPFIVSLVIGVESPFLTRSRPIAMSLDPFSYTSTVNASGAACASNAGVGSKRPRANSIPVEAANGYRRLQTWTTPVTLRAYEVGVARRLDGHRAIMPGATEMVERERKFEAPDTVEIPDVRGASVVDDSEVRLTATYWDTVHRRLLRWGHTLRHRRASDGSEDRWTLKLAIPSQKKGSELQRAEVHVRGSGLYPPPAIRQLARAVIRRGPLTPIATVFTDRHRVELVGREPTDRVELSDDHVSSVLGVRQGPAFRQIEVEAKSTGAGRLMNRVSDALIGAGAVPTDASKLATVLGGTPGPEIVLARSGPGISIRDTVRFAIGSGAARLIANDPAARIGRDREAIHQARVATRRLRSDLKTLEPLLDRAAVAWIRDELRWVGELLGSVRDADVLIGSVEDIGRRLCLAPDAMAAIVTELEQDRRRSHGELVDALASRRYVALVQALVDSTEAPPLADGVDGDRRARPPVRNLVGKSWRRLSRSVKRLDDDPDDAALHEIRKRAKRARYGAELAAAALEDKAGRFAGRLADLQDVLGELQDTVVAEERLAALVRDERISAGDAFTAGKLACAYDEARSETRRRWPASWEAARKKRLRRWFS